MLENKSSWHNDVTADQVYQERFGGLVCASCLHEIRIGDVAIRTEIHKGAMGKSYHTVCHD
jgi:hypothetical protein